MINGIVPARSFRERTEMLPMKIRPDAAPPVPPSAAVCFFDHGPGRDVRCEISLNDFGLEEAYGRFIKEKTYAAAPPDLRGALVDLVA